MTKDNLILGKKSIAIIKYLAIVFLALHFLYIALYFLKRDVEETNCAQFAKENCICPPDIDERKKEFFEQLRNRENEKINIHKIFPYLKYFYNQNNMLLYYYNDEGILVLQI